MYTFLFNYHLLIFYLLVQDNISNKKIKLSDTFVNATHA